MNKSESITELSKALVKFNGEVSKIAKDANNPFFKSNYATLDHIIDEVRPILHKNGLSIMQFPSGDGQKVTVSTLLMHESGEWVQSDDLTMTPVKNDPQAVGSCITYARRYSLGAFLSLNTGADDDGNAASTPQKAEVQPKTTKEATLKAKWETGRGSLEGFDDWFKDQKAKGFTEAQMDAYLTKLLKERGVAS